LGAIVLEPQPRRGLKGVETYNIIDGQQRLTTLQYFLAALSISSRGSSAFPLLPLVDGCVWNPNPSTMENPDIERFKVWPTFRDRDPYRTAMQATNLSDLRQGFPASFTQVGTLKKVGIDHPAALEAIWFFCDQIDGWCAQEDANELRLQNIERLPSSSDRPSTNPGPRRFPAPQTRPSPTPSAAGPQPASSAMARSHSTATATPASPSLPLATSISRPPSTP
jgi:hypothetical protein